MEKSKAKISIVLLFPSKSCKRWKMGPTNHEMWSAPLLGSHNHHRWQPSKTRTHRMPVSTKISPSHNETALFDFLIYFSFKAETTLACPWKIQISPLSSWGKKIQWGRKTHQQGGEGKRGERGKYTQRVLWAGVTLLGGVWHSDHATRLGPGWTAPLQY